ncbi:MAG: RNA polymerase sigma factor [Longimicrobiales bacterium]
MDEGRLDDWAAGFRNGDEHGFRRLVESLTRTLVAVAYRYTGDWDWARDLTQDTWVRVHRNIRRYDPSRSFLSWIHTIHRNGCLDHVRRGWVRHETVTGDAELARLSGPAPDDPAADLEWREFRTRVLAAAEQLSEAQRQAFLRVDVEQGSGIDVARALGISPGTLRATLHHARRRLARILGGAEEAS